MFLGAASFEQLVSSGKVRLEGNSGPLEQIKGMFVQFDSGFEILPGTLPAKAAAKPGGGSSKACRSSAIWPTSAMRSRW